MDSVKKELSPKEILQSYSGRKLRIMEVCGTHTHEIFRLGIRKILPATCTIPRYRRSSASADFIWSSVSFEISIAVLYVFVSDSSRELRFTVSEITVPESRSSSPTMPISAIPV